jgi:hypothetical protein
VIAIVSKAEITAGGNRKRTEVISAPEVARNELAISVHGVGRVLDPLAVDVKILVDDFYRVAR